MITLTPYSQEDPKWSQTIMKPGTLTLGQAGCLVTSCAICLSNFAITVTPGDLCTQLSSRKGFDTNSMMSLNVPGDIYSSVSLVGRFFTTLYPQNNVSKVEIKTAIKNIERLIQLGIPVALNVDTTPKDKVKNPNHWVVAYDNLVNDFQIIDPIDGKAVKLSSRYDFADMAIFGYTAWIGAPISFPNEDSITPGLPSDGVCAWKLAMAIKGVNVQQYTREAFENLINP